MKAKNERTVAYCIAAILLVVGIICYSALAKKAPEQPIRIMLKNTGGNVLFDHKGHLDEAGYAIDCADCHHDMEAEGDRPAPCGKCHTMKSDEAPKRSDAFHMQCQGCHKEDGGPVECAACHAMQ